jgi:hypothetical protein
MALLDLRRRAEVAEAVALPRGDAHASWAVAVRFGPDAVPEHRLVADVLKRLALRKARLGAIEFLERWNDLEVRHRLFEVQSHRG